MYTGVEDFTVSIADDALTIILNSRLHKNHTIAVPIINKKLTVTDLEENDIWYVVDLIDVDKVIDILTQNNIEYLYLVYSTYYREIDSWEEVQMYKYEGEINFINNLSKYGQKYLKTLFQINKIIEKDKLLSSCFNTKEIIDNVVQEYHEETLHKDISNEEEFVEDLYRYLIEESKSIN